MSLAWPIGLRIQKQGCFRTCSAAGGGRDPPGHRSSDGSHPSMSTGSRSGILTRLSRILTLAWFLVASHPFILAHFPDSAFPLVL